MLEMKYYEIEKKLLSRTIYTAKSLFQWKQLDECAGDV